MMNFLSLLYNNVFYFPLLNALMFLTSAAPLNDLGVGIIVLTISIRLITFPLSHKMIKTQHAMRKIEPELKGIQNNGEAKEEQAKAIMALYKQHGINPFSGFLMLFLQLPILIALFQVLRGGIPFQTSDAYLFVSAPMSINTMFLGFIDLTEASILMAVIAAITQFIQARLAMPPKQIYKNKSDFASMFQKQSVYIFPILIFVFAFNMPAAVGLYWTAMNIFAIVHEAIVRRKSQSLMPEVASS
jgi:YidC/Oxa1 family membrane protein insertase